MIYLYIDDSQAAKPWNDAFRQSLDKLKILNLGYKEINIKDFKAMEFAKDDILIARINEKNYKEFKTIYHEKCKGIVTFPSANELYFYNDKWRQYKAFESIQRNSKYSFPNTNPITPRTVNIKYLTDKIPFKVPFIIKKKYGSSSKEVQLVRSITPFDLPCLAQEYIEGANFDYKINVVGNKAFGFRRWNRADDFRASGSGKIEYHDKLLDKLDDLDSEACKLAKQICTQFNFTSMCFDFLGSTYGWIVVEMSYTYDWEAASKCEFYYDLNKKSEIPNHSFAKVDSKVNITDEIVAVLLKQQKSIKLI